MSAQTSDRVSRLAAQYVKMTAEGLKARCSTDFMREATAEDIRTIAASALRQDQTKGLRARLKRMIGR